MNFRSVAIAGLVLAAACDKPKATEPTKVEAPKPAAVTAATGEAAAPAAPADLPAPPDVAAAPADAQVTPSGLASKLLSAGTGTVHPEPQDTVEVHYTGWTTNGKMFDSSVRRGQPASFPLKAVIPGWTEGVQLMVVGEKRRLWIPEKLAYQGRPGPPAGMLVFDIELRNITPGPKPIPPPPDVAAAPKDAKKTASGLAYKILKKGTGKAHPTAANVVEVDYTGWTTDGKMFDSSVVRGEHTSFGLGQVIKGWTEGVQLMTEGEKTRFWIPQDLAYQGRQGPPAGMLVFEIELYKIKDNAPAAPPH